MGLSIEVPDLRDGYVEIGHQIMERGQKVTSRGYKTTEVEDVVIEVSDPYALLPFGVGRSLKPEIGFGEALLLCGGLTSPSMMESISPSFKRFMDGGDLHGAYGRRIRPQMEGIIRALDRDQGSRQAIVTIWDPLHDQQEVRDVPCTICFGFRYRVDGLHMTTVMRSQDFWLGLAYDLFMFGQLGWTVANTLEIGPLASIRHHVMSLHVYERDYEKLNRLHEFDPVADDVLDAVSRKILTPVVQDEPTGFGRSAVRYEANRLRAEKIYNGEPIEDETQHERVYREVLRPYTRSTQIANFAS